MNTAEALQVLSGAKESMGNYNNLLIKYSDAMEIALAKVSEFAESVSLLMIALDFSQPIGEVGAKAREIALNDPIVKVLLGMKSDESGATSDEFKKKYSNGTK